MQAYEILKSEHQVILQVLDCLEAMSRAAIQNGKLDQESAEAALDFFANFADGCHHHKEEEHLFPMMESRGYMRDGGPTGVMLYEHELGRSHVRAMRQNLPNAAGGDAEAVAEFVAHARQYVQLLRDHIHKEDHCLFPMAEQALGAEASEELLARFDKVEEEEEGKHEKYLGIANQLAEKYGIHKAAVTHEGGCGGH